jgi:hypothetical protein
VIGIGLYTKNFSSYLIFFHTLQETQSEALALSKIDPHANKWHTEWNTNLLKVQNFHFEYFCYGEYLTHSRDNNLCIVVL